MIQYVLIFGAKFITEIQTKKRISSAHKEEDTILVWKVPTKIRREEIAAEDLKEATNKGREIASQLKMQLCHVKLAN